MAQVSEAPRFVSLHAPCWRAVAKGHEHDVLAGTECPGRYNSPGERALYMSGSPAGVVAAMTRYGQADRSVLRLEVTASRLCDLRDTGTRQALGSLSASLTDDWLDALHRGERPASWDVAEKARAAGAEGLVDGSRRLAGAWHIILFRWNGRGEPRVVTLGSEAGQ